MLIGKEVSQGRLSRDEVAELAARAFSSLSLAGKDVLVLIPDHTRHGPIDLFFRIIYDLIGEEVSALDYLVASGTHQPLPQDRILARVGITPDEHRKRYGKVRFFAHAHDDTAQLRVAGTIPAAEVAEISNGLFNDDLTITVNKRLYDYDQVIILGPVAPHETAGFSGGNKYFFPGVAGAEITNTFHWISAVITNPAINGVKDNPVRDILNRGADLIGVDTLCFSFAVVEGGGVGCLYIGSPRESWEKAADYSARVHIVYKDRPYRRILGLAPAIYDDLWVGGKVMYKHEPVLAEGGELIIYAPHITEISYTHGRLIREVGYHVRDYFVKQWDRFSHYPKLILAHSTNVRGIGTYEEGVEKPRTQVTLATGIPEEVCRQINLGYRDPASIDVSRWRNREDEGILVVDNAGQALYRLKTPQN